MVPICRQLSTLILLVCFGCFHVENIAEDNDTAVKYKVRPIDVDADQAGKIGRQALATFGYDEIIRLAGVARFIDYKTESTLVLASYDSTVTPGFTAVFSRYAVAAAVTAQADSPLPGPADVAAIGVVVLGLIDAGLLDGRLLDTFADWTTSSGTALMSSS